MVGGKARERFNEKAQAMRMTILGHCAVDAGFIGKFDGESQRIFVGGVGDGIDVAGQNQIGRICFSWREDEAESFYGDLGGRDIRLEQPFFERTGEVRTAPEINVVSDGQVSGLPMSASGGVGIVICFAAGDAVGAVGQQLNVARGFKGEGNKIRFVIAGAGGGLVAERRARIPNGFQVVTAGKSGDKLKIYGLREVA
jgi:hypothetical protein